MATRRTDCWSWPGRPRRARSDMDERSHDRRPATGTDQKDGTVHDLSPQPGDLDPIETAPVEELRALQLERLQWSVRHAYDHVTHYRRAFDEAGVSPDDVRSLEDLARLPFTTKATLRDNYPFGMF